MKEIERQDRQISWAKGYRSEDEATAVVSEVTKFDNLDKGKRYQFRTFAGGEAVPVIYETISDNLRYQSGVPLDVEGGVRIGLK